MLLAGEKPVGFSAEKSNSEKYLSEKEMVRRRADYAMFQMLIYSIR